MNQKLLTLSVACDRPAVAVEVSSQRTVEWTVEGAEAPREHTRTPLNIALVLDQSGSMRGKKLRAAQQAALHALELLDERDRVALLAYDDEPTLLQGSAWLDSHTRAALRAKIEGLAAGGQTDLGSAWLAGCREIAEHAAGTDVSRVLLLTDGLANRGMTDPEEFSRHARELKRRNVQTSTIGVGLDFNETLLETLATEGGGHFHYVEGPEQIPQVFARELGDMLSVVAREVFLVIDIPKGVALEPLGDLPHELDQRRLRIGLGDIYANERRSLFTRVLTPPDMPGTSVVLRATLHYADNAGRAQETHAEIAFSYLRPMELLRVPVYEPLLSRASEVELATVTARALKLERAGEREQARGLLHQALQVHAPYLAQTSATSYAALARRMEAGLNEAERKGVHWTSYQARLRRG